MNNNEERDYAEEAANRAEMEAPECEGHEPEPQPGSGQVMGETVFCDGSCRNGESE